MDISKYTLERVEMDSAWDEFVEQSDEGTLFATSTILSRLEGAKLGLWFIRKKQQTLAALCLVESSDGKHIIANDFVVYGGLMFAPPPPEQSRAQVTAERFRIASFCADELPKIYQDIFLNFAPSFTDLRPFLWFNYGVEGPHFVPDIRFTSLLELTQGVGEGLERDLNYLAASKSRRQQIRYGRGANVVTSSEGPIELLGELYAQTLARQGRRTEDAICRQLVAITQQLIAEGRGKIYFASTSEGVVGSIAVFGWDRKRAYYLYGANNPELRDDFTGTMVIWDALIDLRTRGVTLVDLEGINSPLRGHFKLSFGGSVTPYYHLILKR